MSPARRGPQRATGTVKLVLWALMFAAVFWTLTYQASQGDDDVPEFVYANF